MATAEQPGQDNARLNAGQRKQFLGALAETANVSASARVAGISGGSVYAERRRSHGFRAEWSDALGEGYARLEADLLAEALQAASGTTSDATLKARAQKHRLPLSLLNVHRASVKAAPVAPSQRGTADLSVLKAQLILKLTQMRERAGISLEGVADDDEA